MLISLEIILSRYTSLTLDTNVESFSNDKIMEFECKSQWTFGDGNPQQGPFREKEG